MARPAFRQARSRLRGTRDPSARAAKRVASFAPLAAPDAWLLILGTMPGAASLAAAQYYAHPRNQFWTLMGVLCGAGPDLPYRQRCQALLANGVALWDVFDSCVRRGSADSEIERSGAKMNDLVEFLDTHPAVDRILCNGRLALESLHRHSGAAIALRFPKLKILGLPSTSPAHAGLSLAQKLALWQAAWPNGAATASR